jgi:hypothetical protein
MASKKETSPLRGAKLVKKALEAAKTTGVIASPEPIAASLLRKMKLPNGESLSPAMKELFAFDGAWLGIDYDDEEPEIEATSLEEIIEEHFGEEAVAAFDEAYEMLADDCILFGAELDRPSCLYIGNADDAGEYAVVSLSWEGGVARIGGFVPFDIWVAQELGALERGKDIGDVPAEYAALPQALAQANGDGRVVFTPKAGDGTRAPASDDDDDEDDEDDEDDATSDA